MPRKPAPFGYCTNPECVPAGKNALSATSKPGVVCSICGVEAPNPNEPEAKVAPTTNLTRVSGSIDGDWHQCELPDTEGPWTCRECGDTYELRWDAPEGEIRAGTWHRSHGDIVINCVTGEPSTPEANAPRPELGYPADLVLDVLMPEEPLSWDTLVDEEEGALDGDYAAQALTLDQISAMMHRAATALSRVREIEMTASADHERIDVWAAQETAADRRLIAEVEAQCQAWMRRRLAEIDASDDRGARRSVSTPWGAITTRTYDPAPTIADEKALKAWAIAHPEWLRKVTPPEPAVDWAKVKADVAKRHRQDVPGVGWTEPRTDVTVTIDGAPS